MHKNNLQCDIFFHYISIGSTAILLKFTNSYNITGTIAQFSEDFLLSLGIVPQLLMN